MNLNRRTFIRSTLAMGALGAIKPVSAAGAPKIVVNVILYGGNDGLNTVIPLDQYKRYRELRPNIGFDRDQLLDLADGSNLAFNPGLSKLATLYGEGKVAVINGVAVPKNANGKYDHESSQYTFASCDVEIKSEAPPTGWLGRYLDGVQEKLVPPGIDLGGNELALTGTRFTPISIYSIDQYQLLIRDDYDDRYNAYQAVMGVLQNTGVGETNRQLRVQALQDSAVILERTANYVPKIDYPADNYFADTLYECARLITGGLGVSALTVGLGDFDTHGDQNQDDYHQNTLSFLSEALFAFYRDLERHGWGQQVVILVTSEFGRTAYENSDRGTDHGFSSVAFALGGVVKGGVYGRYPSLREERLYEGNTDLVNDFRSIYGTVAANFLGVDPVPVTGGTFQS